MFSPILPLEEGTLDAANVLQQNSDSVTHQKYTDTSDNHLIKSEFLKNNLLYLFYLVYAHTLFTHTTAYTSKSEDSL